MAETATTTWNVGGIEIHRVLELEVPVPREVLAIGPDPAELIAREKWATPTWVTPDGQVVFALTATAFVSDGQRVIVDPCISFDQRKDGAEGARQAEVFFAKLAAAGFPAESVDLVVHTHVDGVGWTTRPGPDGAGWRPGVPNARHVWLREEVDRVLGVGGPEAEGLRVVLDAGLVEPADGAARLTPHLRLDPAPGHTPGNANVWIEAGAAAAVVVGDLLLHPLQCAEPG